MKKTYIVSIYNNHEWIHTEDAYCKLQLMIKYQLKGYKVWDYPIWLVKFIKKHFGVLLNWGNQNVIIEKRIKGSDQVTWYTPY
jgi:hypothetical protein